MTTTPVEPTWTPTWLAPASVTGWLRLATGSADADAVELARVCVLTERYVERCRPDMWVADDPDDPDGPQTYTPDGEVYHGATMYAAREVRRRNTPAGVESFGDVGVIFTPRVDADIERALRTGQSTVPGFGG